MKAIYDLATFHNDKVAAAVKLQFTLTIAQIGVNYCNLHRTRAVVVNIPGLFFSLFSTVNSKYVHYKTLPMT